MNNNSIPLPVPTNQTVTGPTYTSAGRQAIVDYDYESDEGSIQWTRLIFEEVIAFEYRQAACARLDDILPARTIRCQTQSGFLAEIMESWCSTLGEAAKGSDGSGPSQFQHFTIYFDDSASINVVAASARVAHVAAPGQPLPDPNPS